MKKITGAITAMATPFKNNGALDVAAIKRFTRFQVDSGIHGLVPVGSTGEAATMTLEEHEEVVRLVVTEAKGKVPIIAGAASNDTRKAIALSKVSKKAGADVLLHSTPYYNKPTPLGLIAHFKAIADAVDMPIVIYNVPGRTGLNMSAATVLSIIKKVPQVVGIKEASGNIVQIMEIIKSAPSYFSVLSGDDAVTLPLLGVGADGIISVASNEVPAEMSKMVELGLEGNFEQARILHYKLFDLMNVNFVESNPIPVKAALAMMGKMEDVLRLPLTPLTQPNRLVLKKVLKELKLV